MKSKFVFALVLIISSGTAMAAGSDSLLGHDGHRAFAKTDANNDNFIDKKEAASEKAPAGLAKAFDEIDKNKDGSVSDWEFKKFWFSSDRPR